MKLEDLGYNKDLDKARVEKNLAGFGIGRVIAEHKERYVVKTTAGVFEAEITGNLRYTANCREDFPAVGDWVALTSYEDDFSIIHQILPRFSMIKRQAVGKSGEIQLIATNIDYAFLVQAVDRDFNLNRLERYLTICYESKVKPIIILSKTDLVEKSNVAEMVASIKSRIKNVPVIGISNETQSGYETLKKNLKKGLTYCLLGSSGVGKSTLLNNLFESAVMQTGTISQSTSKGRHVTSHRELVILANGAILIDNPGMREVGIAAASGGLENTFDQISRLSRKCKYKDCTHTGEDACAVIEALVNGELDNSSYENYLKMERERSHFESTLAQRKKKEKDFGKTLKNYKKDMNKNKPFS